MKSTVNTRQTKPQTYGFCDSFVRGITFAFLAGIGQKLVYSRLKTGSLNYRRKGAAFPFDFLFTEIAATKLSAVVSTVSCTCRDQCIG